MGEKKYKISVIGAGKVGTAVGNLLNKKGHRVVAAVATSSESLDKAAPFLPGARLLTDSGQAIAGAQVILITTKDEQIKPVCDGLAAKGLLGPEYTVIHMSGASSLDILSSAKSAGAKVASIHPIQSFANIELAIEKLPGSYFGVTAEGETKDVALSIVADLGGKPIEISDENKTLYHAAACIASNYLVALLHLAEQVYGAAGMDKSIALEAAMPLIKGTISNIESVGTVAALTGPIARGDVKIVKQHLESLKKLDENVINAYKVLGIQTVDIAVEKGTLSQEAASQLIALLKDGGSTASQIS